MQVSVRFLTSSYESRQAGSLIFDDNGTYFDPHAHHSEKKVALLQDIGDVLADIIRRADKLTSHDILTMNTEFVELGANNIVLHLARHEQCISVFVLSAGQRINVLLLSDLDIDCHFRPGGQHWADYLQFILNTIAQQSRMLAISRLWSKGDQEWSLDAEPAEPSGGARAEPSGGARAEPSGGARAEPSGARAEHAHPQHPTARRPLDQCQASGGWCMKHSEDRENTGRRREFHTLWRKLLEIEKELQSNGSTFELENQQTLPTFEELGNKIPKICSKKFPPHTIPQRRPSIGTRR